MYIYFNDEGILTTQINHGEVARQGSTLHLYIAFSKDYDLSNKILDIRFKKPGENYFNSTNYFPDSQVPELKVFEKVKNNEITYDLVDGEIYQVYTWTADSTVGLTDEYGTASVVIRLLEDTSADNNVVENIITKGLIQIYVEKTFGEKKNKITINQTEYNYLVNIVGQNDKKVDKVQIQANNNTSRIEKLELHYIYNLSELDNFRELGVYKIFYSNISQNTSDIFILYVDMVDSNSKIRQVKSYLTGYYERTYDGTQWSEWSSENQYNINGIVPYKTAKFYPKGAIVNYNGENYLSLKTGVYDINDRTSWIKFDTTQKLDLDFSIYSVAQTLGDNDLIAIRSGTNNYSMKGATLKELFVQQEFLHYKGEFKSLESLVNIYPIAESGDYAFVNEENPILYYLRIYNGKLDSATKKVLFSNYWKNTFGSSNTTNGNLFTYEDDVSNVSNGDYIKKAILNITYTSNHTELLFSVDVMKQSNVEVETYEFKESWYNTTGLDYTTYNNPRLTEMYNYLSKTKFDSRYIDYKHSAFEQAILIYKEEKAYDANAEMVQYVWDNDNFTWESVGKGKYVNIITFDEFQDTINTRVNTVQAKADAAYILGQKAQEHSVPRRLSSVQNLDSSIDRDTTYIYVDANGKDAKISISELLSYLLSTVNTVSDKMQEGEYAFVKQEDSE